MSVLKYDRVILTKEMGKMTMVGEVYEVAAITEDSFIIRDARTKIAMGVVSFEEFDNHFEKPQDVKGWTPWTKFADKNGEAAFYRTNFRKVEVKCGDVKATATCNLGEDEFNLYFGIRIAYARCINKILTKQKNENEEALKEIRKEMNKNVVLIGNMIASLRKKGE